MEIELVDECIHSVSVVVPVFMGAETLEQLASSVNRFTALSTTPLGLRFRVTEMVLVNDCGPDSSDDLIRGLAQKYDFIAPVWLSRNFGQHAATIAGMATTTADWIATIDEDGQHDPEFIGHMLDKAVKSRSQLVYAAPAFGTSHGRFRNLTSMIAKRIASIISSSEIPLIFSSFRLVSGEIGRSLAAYAGPSVYLDVALSWIVNHASVIKVPFGNEGRTSSGYSFRKLLGHFWRLALTAGTRPLRYVSVGGALCAGMGLALAIRILVAKTVQGIDTAGWASVIVVVLILGGLTLFAVGIIAEYIGLVVRSTLGQPTYLVIRDPLKSPVFGYGSDNKEL